MKLLLLFLSAVSLGAHAQGGFTVTGHIAGLAEKSAVFLTDANKPGDTLARGFVHDGRFLLKGSVPEPNLYELNMASAKKKAPLFIGNDVVALEGNIQNLGAIRVSGSPSYSDFAAFQQLFNPDFQHLNTLSQLANSPEGAGKKDSISTVYTALATRIESNVDSFISTRESSWVSPFVLVVVNQLSDDPFLLERRLNQLAPAVQTGMYGKYLREQVENGKVGAIGSEAVDFTQNDTAGHPVTLSSFKGKYVLVDFWASWCRPCRMENPHVVSAYGRFKDKNFTVLGVSLDRDKSAWIKAIQDDNLAWVQVSDLKFWSNDVAMKYKVQQIPQNFLIDPQGRIVGKNLRGDELDAKLCALLGCN